MQYDIIFEKTAKSHATGLCGYNIWIQYPDDDYVDFIGFVSEHEVYGQIEHYESLGVTPKMRDVQ